MESRRSLNGSSAGEGWARLVADADGSQQSVTGDVDVRRLDLAPILADKAQKSDLTVTAHVDFHGPTLSQFGQLSGPVTFSAPHVAIAGIAADRVGGSAKLDRGRMTINTRAAMYGAGVTAAGQLILPVNHLPFGYDIQGQVRGLNLQKLPATLKTPAAPTNLNTGYHAVGRGGRSVEVQANLLDSTVADARVTAPSTASFSLEDGKVGYTADANISRLDLQRIGRAFKVSALRDDRFKSALNGHVVVNGSGASAAETEIAATGTLTDSSIGSGRIEHLAFDTTFGGDVLHVKASGAFADLDPAVLSGKPAVAGKVGGELDVDTTVAGISKGLTPDGVEAEGHIVLGPSTVGGLAIDRAAVDGTYHDALGDVRQFELTGPDLGVQAHGTIALNTSGQSNLAVRANTSSLEALTRLVNQKATGIATVEATITGNRSDLRAAGRLTGNDLEFGGQSALQLASDFTAHVPDLAFEHADVSSTTNATFAIVGGQDINEVTAKTEYHDRNIGFEVTAKQPKRTLSADGSLALHTDQNLVSLDRLGFQTQGMAWQTAPGAQAQIGYGGGSVSVKDLRLVSDSQELVVSGTFGQPEDTMRVTAQNVNLAAIDALLLRPPILSGTLNASAEIAGACPAVWRGKPHQVR